jgi:hypothetical protein
MTNAVTQMANPPANVEWRRSASAPVSRVGFAADRSSPSGSDDATASTLVTSPVSVPEGRAKKLTRIPRQRRGIWLPCA